MSGSQNNRPHLTAAIDSAQAPEVSAVVQANTDRSADAHPTIDDVRDLERVTSPNKPTAPSGLSEEARRQIAPKLKPRKAA